MMRQFIKRLILSVPVVIFSLSFMLPLIASAEEAPASRLSPLTDTQCWTQQMCANKTNNCAYCFKEGEGPCSAPFGRCYHPHEPIDLLIPLGSTGQVTDMADYIATAYRYVLSIGSILAVVVIIVSGIIYLTAGGNPSTIGVARDYIGGAVIGLILLFTSYLILNTLNPDLVRLKMPSIYMIRPADLPATFCADIRWEEASGRSEEERANVRPMFYRADDVAEGASPTNPRRLKDYTEATSSGGRNYDPEQLTCNFAFYSPTIAGQSPCYGNGGCEPGEDGAPSACVRDPDTSRRDWFICQRAYVSGNIEYGNYPELSGEGNQLQMVGIQIKAWCNDNSFVVLGGQSLGEAASPSYNITLTMIRPTAEENQEFLRNNICSNNRGLKGIYLRTAIDENDTVRDDRYYFWFGKPGCTNLGDRRYSVTFNSREDWQNNIPSEELWNWDELFHSGIRCNLRLENLPDSFPIHEGTVTEWLSGDPMPGEYDGF